jgi:predicted TIM-barrel fold metal-dependent hydrolase
MFVPSAPFLTPALERRLASGIERERAEREARLEIAGLASRNNDWCAEFCRERPELDFFCGVDAALLSREELLAGLERWHRAGARGVKTGPFSMKMFGDDPRLLPLYDYCESASLPILMQAGGPAVDGRGLAYSDPRVFEPVLRQFPRLVLVFAHMAHFPHLPEEGLDELCALTRRHAGVYAELSHRLDDVAKGALLADELVRRIRRVGAERLLFGSSFPLDDAAASAAAFRGLPLRSDEQDAIAYRNYDALIGR